MCAHELREFLNTRHSHQPLYTYESHEFTSTQVFRVKFLIVRVHVNL